MSQNIRKIIHIDMDAFFASVEQRDFPQYRNKPLAVGNPGRRGVISAASYEARKFGIHSAMPSAIAKGRCPNLIFAPVRFDKYKEVSAQIMDIFYDYTDLVEPLSIDEAFLDVTHNKRNLPSATLIAKEIKKRIKQKTQLTASAGISVNKFLAKIASDIDKPDGLTLIPPDKMHEFIKTLPIEKFFGVGKVTARKMKNLGIYTGADLLKRSLEQLYTFFGKTGVFYYNIVRGEDNRRVQPFRLRKSIGAENTFLDDIADLEKLNELLREIVGRVWARVEKAKLSGKTITLKMKYHDFVLKTHSLTLSNFLKSCEDLEKISINLMQNSVIPGKPIRLLGVSISNLNNAFERKTGVQLTLNF